MPYNATCQKCGKLSVHVDWWKVCLCDNRIKHEDFVKVLAIRYEDGHFLPGCGQGRGDAETYRAALYPLPVTLQPGLNLDRLTAYKKAVEAGFYNDNIV